MSEAPRSRKEHSSQLEKWKDLKSGRVVAIHIPTTRIGQYQDAGEQSGYDVSIVAKPGECYVACIRTRSKKTVIEREVPEGFVAVTIRRPDDETTHEPFWSTLSETRPRRAAA